MTQFTSHSTGFQVTSSFPSRIRNKTILLTGPTIGGIGYETLLSIAAHNPKLIILAGRSQEKLDAAVAGIEAQYPGTNTQTIIIDLGSLASVRKAAEEVQTELDIIICNAGVMSLPEFTTSKDGFELQFASNHLAHFLLVNLLVPKLLPEGCDASEKRIVNVASSAYLLSGVRFDDIDFGARKEYEKWAAYGQSKTANMLFSISLAEKLGKRGVKSFSLHPGSILTGLQQYVPEEELVARRKQYASIVSDRKTVQQGCATTLVAAFDPSIDEMNGAFLQDGDLYTPVKTWAMDPEEARKLWELSEKMVGQKFEY
ncbi:NAD(P)-binding protein [Wilcoxina mikolae CBS 423.85]|nr:NAD(P)-binding protein [Wilcoxina mikolae CBS 423.85]